MPDKNPKKQQINLELTPEVAEGIYANLAVISHSNAEFVIDFTRILPGTAKAKVQSRIVMTPQHLKQFLRALQENVNKFEAQFGEIKTDRPGNNFPPISGPPKIN